MNRQEPIDPRAGPRPDGLTTPFHALMAEKHRLAARVQASVVNARPSGRPTRMEAPATCGELGQGHLDGEDFRFNCPIDLYARATIHPSSVTGLKVEGPGSLTRVTAAIERLGRQFGFIPDERVTLYSPIPRSKGMASSTADISAALMALCQHRGVGLSQAGLARLLSSIAPSSCVHVTGIGEVNPLSGQILNSWPAPRGIRVIVLDCGGTGGTGCIGGIDRERALAIHAEARQHVLHFRALLRYGLTMGDPEAIGRGATLSARLNQRILPKPPLEDLIRIALAHGAWGVNCAHSGTVLGVLYNDARPSTEALLNAIEGLFGRDLALLGHYRIISGGCQHAI